MKQVLVCAEVFLVSFCVSANVEVFSVCAASGLQQRPAVCGDVVVWEDQRHGGWDIYGKNLATQQEFAVCTAGGDQRYPRISGNLVVWQDARNAATGIDIYGRDLTTGVEFEICRAAGNQELPAVSGTIVVWMDKRNADTGNDIYGYCLATEQEFVVCRDAGSQERPAIDGDWVVWMDNRLGHYQIYGCRLSVQPLTAVRLSPSNTAQGFPAVRGNLVVWHERRGSNMDDVYGLNLETGQEFLVCGAAANQVYAAVSERLVVWQDARNGASRRDIFGYDPASGNEFAISAANVDQTWPAVSGGTVVWEQGGDIRGARLAEPTVLTVLWPDGGEMLLAGTTHRILWQTEGPAIDEVRISFSYDDGQSWEVVEPNVPADGAYWWTTPDADSQLCRVRISDIGATGAADVSDGVFTVFRCSAALTADLNGDCRVDIADFADFAGQWMTCGNAYDPAWCWEGT